MKKLNIENEKINIIVNIKKTKNNPLRNNLLISKEIDLNNNKELISHNSCFLTNIENEEDKNENNIKCTC